MNIEALVQAHQEALLASIEGYGQPPLSRRVREAFFAVPRHLFVHCFREYVSPEWKVVDDASLWKHLPAIYRHDGLGIYGPDDDGVVATISAPGFVLQMLDALRVDPGMRVLEIGAGSGYNAGLLGHLVGPGGAVDSVEILAPLAEAAARSIARAGLENVRILHGDAGSVLRDDGPYDRIVFTTGSYDLPAFLYDRLREGGLLQIPLKVPGGGDVLFLFRAEGGTFVAESARPCDFVPLTGQGRMRELDARPIDAFAPWSALWRAPARGRPFFMGERGALRFAERTFPLRSYLAVVEPRTVCFVEGFGVWDEGSSSLALVRPDRITVHGGPAAGAILDAHLEAWLARGMPSMATMRLTAYRAGSAPAPAEGQRLLRRPSSDLLWGLG
jgi:protein-L-isoaspartate(D-aspartate) O-methyltransferase